MTTKPLPPPVTIPKEQIKELITKNKENFANLSLLRAVRLKCLNCCGDSAYEVKLCTVSRCPLYPYRMGKNPDNRGADYVAMGYKGEEITLKVPSTAFQAIKAKCTDCAGPDFGKCSMEEYSWCPLMHYLQQKKAKKRILTPEQKEALAKRLKQNLG